MNIALPIYSYREEIVSAVNENNVVIITAETGSGKSTQVCQFLWEEGYEVIVTEPRRLAARTLAERVAEEMGEEVGKTVGFRTAFERADSAETRILFATDGLQLVRSLTGSYRGNSKVLVIDEVHEWNLNIETIIAWTKKQVEIGWDIKVVIMSATLETEKLQQYFGDATCLEIPGRCFKVEKFELPESHFISTITTLIGQGKNVLAFVSGKKEINETIEELAYQVDAVLLPLHGELSPAEQRNCFEQYDRPKVVVATNVAQTSVTVPDIDAVVDSGVEKQIETYDGVEGLFLHHISKADCEQRRGRAGRTKEGLYYLCSDKGYESREEYPVPEMQRSVLDQVVLRLASAGIDATDLEFFHQPAQEALQLAKKSLTNLGALENNQITGMGRKMAKMPISARYSRMVIEAERLGVVDDVITIAAILECGSFMDHSRPGNYDEFSTERNSDLLVDLDIWNKLSTMGYVDFNETGVKAKVFFKVKELRKKLFDVLQGVVTFGSTGDRTAIKKAVISGMIDHLYHRGYSGYVNGDYVYRQLDRKSCLNYSSPEWIVGNPITIQFKTRYGGTGSLDLVTMATPVEDVAWLGEVAPQLMAVEDGEAFYDEFMGCCVIRNYIFNGVMVSSTTVSVPDHPEASRLEAEWKEQERIREEERRIEEARRKKIEEELYNFRMDGKQRRVDVEGKKYEVNYGWQDTYIYLSEAELFSISSTKSVKLKNGELLMIRCGTCKANNFPSLVSMVETSRLKNAWEIARRSLPSISSAKEKVVLEWFDRVGKKEIIKDKDGESVYGYVYLALESNNTISLKITDDEEEANSETYASLKFLFGRIILRKYQEKEFGVTAKERKANKDLFDEFARDLLDGLTVENFQSRVQDLDEIYKEVAKVAV